MIEKCYICGKPLFYISELTGLKIPCLCECEKKKREEEAKASRVKECKASAMLGERYADVSFSTTETGKNKTFDAAFKRCMAYVDAADKCYKDGYGILIYGDAGTGKTHLAACIIDGLNKDCIEAVFSTMENIRRAKIEDGDLFAKYKNADFLVIDDLGAERFQNANGDLFAQEVLYEIVNFRYISRLPTIFTSNYCLSELLNDRGIARRTIDRIAEMTVCIHVEGESRRLKKKNGKVPF